VGAGGKNEKMAVLGAKMLMCFGKVYGQGLTPPIAAILLK